MSWKAVAIASAVVAIVSLTVTVIVASVRAVDILSVVALALAIVAFVVQIIVFILQTASSETQAQHAADLYAQTISALSKIEEKSEGTRDSLSKIEGRIFDALTKAAAETTPDSGAPTAETSERVARRAADLIRAGYSRDSASGSRPAVVSPVPADEDRPTFLNKAPDKQMLQAADEIAAKIQTADLIGIQALARDQEKSEARGRPVGLARIVRARQLFESGLITRHRVDWSTIPVFRLTPQGEALAFVLNQGAPAQYENLVRAKANLDAFQRESRESRERERRNEEELPVTE